MIVNLVIATTLLLPIGGSDDASGADVSRVRDSIVSADHQQEAVLLRDRRDDRAVALNRPSRSGSRTLSIVRRAATVPHGLVPFASCVLRRESGGSLDRIQSGVGARNGGSSAQGRWQFINNDWQHSLPWHVRDRLVQFGMPKAQANEVRRYLDKRPIATWHGYWQDIGFVETIERGGRHHWDGPGC